MRGVGRGMGKLGEGKLSSRDGASVTRTRGDGDGEDSGEGPRQEQRHRGQSRATDRHGRARSLRKQGRGKEVPSSPPAAHSHCPVPRAGC